MDKLKMAILQRTAKQKLIIRMVKKTLAKQLVLETKLKFFVQVK